MYQRGGTERRQLSDTSASSAFFVSHGSPPPPPPPPPPQTRNAPPRSSSYTSPSTARSSASYPQPYYAYNDSTPTYSSPPTTYNNGSTGIVNNPYTKPASSSSKSTFIVAAIIWTILVGGGMVAYYEYSHLPKVHRLKRRDKELHEAGYERHINTLNQQKVELEEKTHQLETKLRDVQESARHAVEWKDKSAQLETALEELKRNVQDTSRQMLTQRYGPGPYSVEVEVSSTTGEGSEYMTFELTTATPHTTLWFLEQTQKDMYNFGEFAFTNSGSHLILARPTTEGLRERLEEYGLTRVVFPEYSHERPHTKYTVGLAGRPGGPNWYINMNDNTQLHGPGGYAADGSADPCFAVVTRGFDVADRIHNLGAGEDWKDLQPNIVVRSMKLLT